MSLNKVMLIGNVGRDPEVRYLENGNNNPQNSGNAKVASFTLATTERYRDRSGETRENTEWHNIVAWRNSADVAEKYIRKGTQLYVEGRLRTRSWTDQTGNKRYTTEIVVDNLQLLGKRSDNPGGQGDGAPQGGYQGGQSYGMPQQQNYGGQGYGQQQSYGAPQQPQSYQPAAAPAQPYQPQPVPAQAPQQSAPRATEPIDLNVGGDGTDDLPF